MKVSTTFTDTMQYNVNIEMDNDERMAILTVNRLISHLISVVGLETCMTGKEDGITIDMNKLAQAKAALQAIAENKEWEEI